MVTSRRRSPQATIDSQNEPGYVNPAADDRAADVSGELMQLLLV
jgi:hypothetical protein